MDRRSSPRHRVLKTGKIVVNAGRSTFDCTVRNLSDTGALLLVASSIGIPDQFQLVISAEPPRPCRVVRRTAQELGVSFVID